MLRQDDFEDHVEQGHANVEAIELVRRHCLHARIEMINGNSMVGNMLGIPMGLLEICCKHAPPPPSTGHVVLDLAVEFYRRNCVACTERQATGEMPNLSVVVAKRDEEEERRLRSKEKEALERVARHEHRKVRRQLAIAAEGYVVRDLADWIDHLDGPEPKTTAVTPVEEEANRQIINSAKHAPELFTPVLVETLLGLAADTAEATAFVALSELVTVKKCKPRDVVDAALRALALRPEAEAAKVLYSFKDDLRQNDLPSVLDRLIDMVSRQAEPFGPEPVPDGILAAADVDLQTVLNRLIARLDSDNESERGAAADAAVILLNEIPSLITALGPALVTSIRTEDRGYADYPHPSASAARALAEGWRVEPEQTMSIIEDNAAALSDDARAVLVRTVSFLQRWREDWDAPEAAGLFAVQFCLRHIGGDWGEEAAKEASEEIGYLARKIPHLFIPNIDALLGVLLQSAAPVERSPLLAVHPEEYSDPLFAMERASAQIARGAMVRRIAECIGRAAEINPRKVLPKMLTLLQNDAGDDKQAQQVRLSILDAFKEAVCASLLREIVPVTYTALLSSDAAVRAKGIDLWVECARVAKGNLPATFVVLAESLLTDKYRIVHTRMLSRLPQLRLPNRVSSRLIGIVGWLAKEEYADTPYVLVDAVRSLRHLAGKLDNDALSTKWYGLALSCVSKLSPHDRQRLLISKWPNAVLSDSVWIRTAIGTLASPELQDYYNERHDPLLALVMECPHRLALLPFEEIVRLSDVHKPRNVRRALEPVELLQSAGRWADAAKLARRVEEWQPPGLEGQSARQFARLIAASAAVAATLVDEGASRIETEAAIVKLRKASKTSSTEKSDGERTETRDEFVDMILTSANAWEALMAPISDDPDLTADKLDKLADTLQRAEGNTYASTVQRTILAESWRVAALLLRYDACIRRSDSAADRLLAAARRQIDVIDAKRRATPHVQFRPALREFASLATRIQSPQDVTHACSVLAKAVAPIQFVGRLMLPTFRSERSGHSQPDESVLAVCIAGLRGSPVTDVLVVRSDEFYTLEITVWLSSWPVWAEKCIVEPISLLSQTSLALPRYEFSRRDAHQQADGLLFQSAQPLHCLVQQPVKDPAIDCPLLVRLMGDDKEETVEVAGYRRLRLRPFDPSRDMPTEHEQTDQRLLIMFDGLSGPQYDTEDVRAFCRLFGACVRAGQSIMFEKTFQKGTRVTEAQFHDELEKRLRTDRELCGRLTRRDAVAGGFDDLLHDDVIAELKVERNKPVTVETSVQYIGQPTQYGVGRGSQLSVLIVLDHSPKEVPPGVLENYIGWVQPRLHGLDDAAYPSRVGVLIINTNLPVPSAWSRFRSK